MPRYVDHDERRQQIIAATWRLIATKGIAATTMREIAREAGVGNGSLTPYFADKESILTETFHHVFRLTDTLIQEEVGGLRGVEAIRAMLMATFPRTQEGMLIARIVVPFYALAADTHDHARFHRATTQQWREAYARHLVEAIDLGEVRADIEVDAVVDEIMILITGMPVIVLLRPDADEDDRTRRQDRLIENVLSRLGRPE